MQKQTDCSRRAAPALGVQGSSSHLFQGEGGRLASPHFFDWHPLAVDGLDSDR